MLQAMLNCEGMQCYVADLFSLVSEGQQWHPRHASAKAKHAAIWRQTFEAQQKREDDVPQFRWTPAHKALDEVLDQHLLVADWAGNLWADYFAKGGLASIAWRRAKSRSLQAMSNACARVRIHGLDPGSGVCQQALGRRGLRRYQGAHQQGREPR